MSKNDNFEERLKKLCINTIENEKNNPAQVLKIFLTNHLKINFSIKKHKVPKCRKFECWRIFIHHKLIHPYQIRRFNVSRNV